MDNINQDIDNQSQTTVIKIINSDEEQKIGGDSNETSIIRIKSIASKENQKSSSSSNN